MMHVVKLSDGSCVPALGQGTWYLGDVSERRKDEIAALRSGIEAGMTLIDTAEMYGNGRSESLVGEAIRPYDRSTLFLVSKVLPPNANRKRLMTSLDASLARLGTDYLDLYLYHWRGNTSLAETVTCLEEAKAQGKIRAWGVSNFDLDDMEELWGVPNGRNCVVNQVLYHMGSRGIEYSLLPWMREHDVALMAYCPLAQAGRLSCDLFGHPVVQKIAQQYRASPAQIALAWVIRETGTIAIPRTGKKEHALLNADAGKIVLSTEDMTEIDRIFLPPTGKEPLDIE